MISLKRRKKAQNPLQSKKRQPMLFLLLSFCIPMLFLSAGFVLQKVHPFGDRQILVVDFWHQYYPFLKLLHEKLQSGGSLLYTWDSGLGSNFVSMAAYYAASPLNLLTLLVPDAWLREAVTGILLLKVGFAGLFFALFLKGTFHRNDFSLCIFSAMYALCSYMLGYYWNIIWLDTVALLPLVVLGLVQLVRDGKYRLYVLALGLSLFSNFYIGLFTCIFAALAFPCLCICYLRFREVPGRVLAMLLSSLLGGALAAVILLPAYQALQLTYSVQNAFPEQLEFYESWRTLLANLISYHAPTSKEGLPNLACGVFSLVLFGPFLRSGKIRIREKVLALLLLLFLLVSCNCNVLNYLWHGMHFPNMLPFRFSFLFSFVLLTVGYRGFWLLLEEHFRIWDILAMLLMGAAVFLLSYGIQENRAVYLAGISMFLYIFICLLTFRQIFGHRFLYLTLSIVLCFELFENVRLGTETVSTSDYTTYPSMEDTMETLLQTEEEQDSELFSRTEISTWYSLNDPALYGYHGLSQFSSTANVHVTRWMKALGLPASEAGNRYYYGGGTPVTNMFTSIRYLMTRGNMPTDSEAWEQVAQESGGGLYQNQYALPIGFWTSSDLVEYTCVPDGNPFENQNTLFHLATGIETPLFTPVDVDSVEYTGATAMRSGYGVYTYTLDASADSHTLVYNYPVTVGETLYGYLSSSDISSLTVQQNGGYRTSYSFSKQSYIFPMGYYAGSETAGLSLTLPADIASGTVTAYVYVLNREVLEQGYALLQQGGLTLTEFSDTKLSGTMTANTDGLCYFSIPYEVGWHAEVDGEPAEITPVGEAMVAVAVTAGTHTITLRYCPDGFVPGAALTVGSIVILLGLFFLERKRKKPLLAPAASQSKPEPKEISTEPTATVEIPAVEEMTVQVQSHSKEEP